LHKTTPPGQTNRWGVSVTKIFSAKIDLFSKFGQNLKSKCHPNFFQLQRAFYIHIWCTSFTFYDQQVTGS
jgi:hypothetical protein